MTIQEMYRNVLWSIIKFIGLRKSFAGERNYPTEDDFRNPFWRSAEARRVKVEWSKYLFDLRVGFKRNGKWKLLYAGFWKPVNQNFWNGVFTLNVYVVKTHLWGLSVLIPRIGMVIRFSRNYWFQAGIGVLFDRGELAIKCTIKNWSTEEIYNPNCNAKGWEEGSV